MKKFVFLIFLFFATLIMADTLKISADFLSFLYTERDDDGNFLDSEKRDNFALKGFSIDYSHQFANGFFGGTQDFIELQTEYIEGNTNYTGSLFSIKTGVRLSTYTTTTTNKLLTTKLRFNETQQTSHYDTKIFCSLGYRYWERNILGPYGYKEQYKWIFADIGVGILIHDKAWHIGVESAYQYAFQPTMQATLQGTPTFDLGHTYGYYYEIPLQYDLNKNYTVEIAYRYDYYKINKSNTVNNLYEPQSETKNKTLKIGVIIRW